MMTREQIEQIILMVLAAAILLAGAFYAIVKPQWTRLQNVGTESAQVKAELAVAREKVDTLPRLMRQCRNIEEAVTRQERQFVGDGNFDTYLGIIKRCADAVGMSLGTVQLRSDVNVVRGKVFVERWVTFDTIAPYHTIGAWIAMIEQETPFVRMVSASVRGGDGLSGKHPATLTVAFLTINTKP
jgi:Tfp pilus assembly protein PilO